RDDVDLARAAAVVARQDGERMRLEETGGGVLGCAADRLAVGRRAAPRHRQFVSGSEGWICPSRISAQLSWRSMRPSGASVMRPVRPSKGQLMKPRRMAAASMAAS